MSDTLVSPSRTITVGQKKYVLDGSFGTLRAVQEAFDMDVVYLLSAVYGMRLDQIARLIAIAAGVPNEAEVIGQTILDTMDVLDFQKGTAYPLLKTELTAWLLVAIAPKANREKKRQDMTLLLEKQKSLSSPGPTTSDSPSAPSAGSPANSGEATSGS